MEWPQHVRPMKNLHVALVKLLCDESLSPARLLAYSDTMDFVQNIS